MYGPTNGLKGIVGLIALVYFAFLVVKVAVIIATHGGLDVQSALSYGMRILAFGGLVYASFAINAYRFSGTPVYYLMTTVLMAQIGWYGYLKAVALSTDRSVLMADQAPVVSPAKPVLVSSSPPAQSPVVAATPPPPKPVDNSPWPTDGPSGPVMITHDENKYLNPDHIHAVIQPIPVPDMATTEETTNSATSAH